MAPQGLGVGATSGTSACTPGKHEVTMERLILAFAWAADEEGISQEATNDAAWAIMRAWYAVQDYGGWPEAPATRNLPPPPPALSVVRDLEPERD